MGNFQDQDLEHATSDQNAARLKDGYANCFCPSLLHT